MEINVGRFQFTPFWKVTKWGFPFIRPRQGGDEWNNPSIWFAIPLVGMFVFFYGRDFDRSMWFLSGSRGSYCTYISPDYGYTALVPMGHVTPTLLYTDEVFRTAGEITRNNWARVIKRNRKTVEMEDWS